MKNLDKGTAAVVGSEGGFEALQSMLKGEYTEESTGARTIRQTGGKDRHSKVFTARGPRDRRVRLSVATAIRFYDLQDRLGFEQPSKAVEWLLLNCQPSIQGLPQLASLHPVRVASALSQPAAYATHNRVKEQEPCYRDEHKDKHHQKERILDTVIHPNGEKNFHHYNFPTYQPYSWHNGLFPFKSSDDPLQDSIEEDLSQYSNPSSSGGSSDHPISFSKGTRPQCRVTLAEAIPTSHSASLASMHGQCLTSFAPSPDQPTIHTNKRHRMQQCTMEKQEGGARSASSSGMIRQSLGINNGPTSQMSRSSFDNMPSFNRLTINNEDAFLMSNFSLQSQLQNDDMQKTMKLANFNASHCVDIPQYLFTAQASQLADNILIQGPPNESNTEAEYMNGQVCTLITSNMSDNMQLYSKMAFQQVDDLVCGNLYATPSPSESTSINPLAAVYSKLAGACNHHTDSNVMVDDQKLAAAANILFRPSWNPASGLQ